MQSGGAAGCEWGPMCLLEEVCVWVWDVGTGLMGYVFMAVLQVSNTDP